MFTRRMVAGLPALLAATLVAASCSDAVGPGGHGPGLFFATSGSGFALDQWNGTLSESGTQLVKGFNPVNPQLGDAIIATFFWLGDCTATRTVSDRLTDVNQTPVGNTYNLADCVASGGIAMATYVATNVQNFPGGSTDQNQTLAVQANFLTPVSDGGVMLSAYTGPTANLAAHASASGTGFSPSGTVADPGPAAVAIGALAYGVTMSNGLAGRFSPTGFTQISTMSDNSMVGEGDYAVQPTAGTADPQWTWFFNAPSTWLASVVVLNPAATHLVFTVQPSTTLPLFTITPAPKVAATDDLGNTVTSFTGSATIAIGHNGGLLLPGTLSGTKTVAFVNGVATFSDLSIDQAGNGYTLVATAPSLKSGESAPFNISAM